MQKAIESYKMHMEKVTKPLLQNQPLEQGPLMDAHTKYLEIAVQEFTSRAIGDLQTVVLPKQNQLMVPPYEADTY